MTAADAADAYAVAATAATTAAAAAVQMFAPDAPPLTWDTRNEYTRKSIELYYLSYAGKARDLNRQIVKWRAASCQSFQSGFVVPLRCFPGCNNVCLCSCS